MSGHAPKRWRLWLGRRTLGLFVLVVLVLFFLPQFVTTMSLVGNDTRGIPFVFWRSNSAPPPLATHEFHAEALVADFAVYYLLAVGISALWGRKREA